MHHATALPVASLIIWRPSHCNSLDYTLHSLLHQSIGTRAFEVIIVNPGAAAEVVDVVDKYTHSLNIRYLPRKKGSRRAEPALKTGIRNARGQLCILADPGLLLGSTCIEAHVLRHEQEQQAGAGIGYAFCFPPAGPGDGTLSHLAGVLNVKQVDQSIGRLRALGIGDGREAYYQEWNDQLENLASPALLFEASNTAIDAKVLLRAVLTPGVADYGAMAARLWADKIPVVLNRQAEAIAYPRAGHLLRTASPK